ncbi:MATH domain and coiled-coil domain-containing protein [Cardamine amara subsp. amara]|uniref:MATH domain and coiled-coil domain-containing protein n=1 Tax=Cardamine amara subsp. amara TaxID=228776 RepID=A0ABD1A414_CARAN
MAKSDEKHFVWEIKNFSSERCYSISVMVGDCKWRVVAGPKGCKEDYLFLYLEVADFQLLPYGWRRHVKFLFSIVNQLSQNLAVREVTQQWFDQNAPIWGFEEMIPLAELNAKDSGVLVDGDLIILARVQVLEVIGTLDESIQSNGLLNKTQEFLGTLNESIQSNGLLNQTREVEEIIDVNGFQVLPSQAESVRRIFEKHPDIAVGVQVKNQHLRTTLMNFLVNVIETMCQSLRELSNEDLVEVDIALTYLKNARFKVDWLEKKLDQVKENKEKELSGLVKLQEIEQQLHDLMHKCETKKSEVLSIGAPLKFDDVV